MQEQSGIDEIKKDIEKPEEDILAIRNSLSPDDAQKRVIRTLADDAINSSPYISELKRTLYFLVGGGLAIWFFGIVYGGIQIASVSEQASETLAEIRQIEGDVINARTILNEFLQGEFNAVLDEKASALEQIAIEKINAIDSIHRHRDLVIEALQAPEVSSSGIIIRIESPWSYAVISIPVVSLLINLVALIFLWRRR